MHILITSITKPSLPLSAPEFTYGTPVSHIPVPHRRHTPLQHAAAFMQQAKLDHHDEFLPTHEELNPGTRLLDTNSSRIHFHTHDHPPMRQRAFPAWLEDKKRFISTLHIDNSSLLSFSDGSVRPDLDFHSTAAYLLSYKGTTLHSRSFATGQASSFDAELAGLAAALHDSIIAAREREAVTSIHLFADNVAALDSLFQPTFHSSQIVSILATRKAREWLQESDSHHIHLHWVPGHKGVELNEVVDAMTNEAYDIHPRISRISHAYARVIITKRIMQDWRKIPSRGTKFFPARVRNSRTCTRGGPILSVVGDSPTLTSRLTRAILAHAPIGEYRSKYLPNESSTCPRCGVLETRHHILESCPLYQRPRRAGFVAFITSSHRPITLLKDFLTNNPLAFTFDSANLHTPNVPRPPD